MNYQKSEKKSVLQEELDWIDAQLDSFSDEGEHSFELIASENESRAVLSDREMLPIAMPEAPVVAFDSATPEAPAVASDLAAPIESAAQVEPVLAREPELPVSRWYSQPSEASEFELRQRPAMLFQVAPKTKQGTTLPAGIDPACVEVPSESDDDDCFAKIFASCLYPKTSTKR